MSAILQFFTANWRLVAGGVAVAALSALSGALISRCGSPSADDLAAATKAAHEAGRTTGAAEGRATAREEVARALEGTAAAHEARASEAAEALTSSREREALRLGAGRADPVPTMLDDLRSLGIEVLP